MTTELRTIQIEAYRDPDGGPVCETSKESCPLLNDYCTGWESCNFNGVPITNRHGGYLRPVEGCPVWGGE